MNKKIEDLKVAIVCDWLTSRGGAEKVTEALAGMFPGADIYASVVDECLFPWLKDRRVYTTWLARIPVLNKKHQLFPHIRPYLFENFDLSQYDLVISSCSAESKSVLTRPGTVHICYCHTPVRYYWSDYHDYFTKRLEFGWLNPIVKLVMPYLTNHLRMYDRLSAERVDYYIANSINTKTRINKYYRRQAGVINPPVEFDEKNFGLKITDGDYYLYLGRLIPYKKADLVVEAFVKNGHKLKVSGEGPLMGRIKKLAADSDKIELLGYVSDNEKWRLIAGCKALIFPAEEDFGIVPVEAMSLGKPVIAFGRGGALESVVDGKTGIFFKKQNVWSLNRAIEVFEKKNFDMNIIKEHAGKFSRERFMREITDFVAEKMNG